MEEEEVLGMRPLPETSSAENARIAQCFKKYKQIQRMVECTLSDEEPKDEIEESGRRPEAEGKGDEAGSAGKGGHAPVEGKDGDDDDGDDDDNENDDDSEGGGDDGDGGSGGDGESDGADERRRTVTFCHAERDEESEGNGDESKEREEEEEDTDLVADLDGARFIALGSMLLVTNQLQKVDFRYKQFADLSGSGARMMLCAALMYSWQKVSSFECTKTNLAFATALRRVTKAATDTWAHPLTETLKWVVTPMSFKEGDWIEADVVFFDCLPYEGWDEGVLLAALQSRMRGLQAGSYAIILTLHEQSLLTPSLFGLVYCKTFRYGVHGRLTAWLYKHLQHSNDHRVDMMSVNGTSGLLDAVESLMEREEEDFDS